MKLSTLMTGFLMLFAAQAAHAIEEDQLRGEILSVDADNRVLEIEITEVGDNLDEMVGTTETYRVPRSVPIEFEIEAVAYRRPGGFDFSDIKSGDRVLLDFNNLADPSAVTRLRNEDPQDATIRERVLAAGEPVEQLEAETEGSAQTASGAQMAFESDTTTNDDRRMAANDTRSSRSVLPETASPIPMIALIGLALAGFAFALRLGRS